MQYHPGLGVGHLHTRPSKATPPSSSSDPVDRCSRSVHERDNDEELEIRSEGSCDEGPGYTAGGGQDGSENETDWFEESDSDNSVHGSDLEESDTDDEGTYDYEN
jgi:hypothetical protein